MITYYLAVCDNGLVKDRLMETMSTLKQHLGNAKKCLEISADLRNDKWMTTALDHDATLDCLNLNVHQFVEWLRKTKVDSFKMVQTYEQLTAYLKELLVSEKVPDLLALHNTLAHYFAVVMGYHACLVYTSDASDHLLCVDLRGRPIIDE